MDNYHNQYPDVVEDTYRKNALIAEGRESAMHDCGREFTQWDDWERQRRELMDIVMPGYSELDISARLD